MSTESAVSRAAERAEDGSEFAAYLPHIRRRWLAEQAAGQRRQEEAWIAARQAAAVLRTGFGASRVLAFGSLVHPGHFSARSDIDLAVSGIQPARFFRAWAVAGAACPFELNLVDVDDCSPRRRALIETEGVEL